MGTLFGREGERVSTGWRVREGNGIRLGWFCLDAYSGRGEEEARMSHGVTFSIRAGGLGLNMEEVGCNG
jgi:hypothetical protein